MSAADGRAESLQVRDEVLTAQPRRATILLVDDEELVRAATAEMLRDMGHRVIQAETGAAAISCAKSGDPIDLLGQHLGVVRRAGSRKVNPSHAGHGTIQSGTQRRHDLVLDRGAQDSLSSLQQRLHDGNADVQHQHISERGPEAGDAKGRRKR